MEIHKKPCCAACPTSLLAFLSYGWGTISANDNHLQLYQNISAGAFPRHIGRTKGGLNSKLHAVCDGLGWPVRLHLTAGQVSDFRGADVLLAVLPDETEEVIGDRGYDSKRIRLSLAERNITACIPPKKNRKSKPPYNWHLYKKRHLIENMFA
ncbi:transposase [Komagataeibacter sp. FNDCR2]|uniref:transposase n=1 Tax=Komagataeibacter sp. FNDCR2 TaxID=2878682 RepID=UPI00351D5BF0|nr:transposase [Komagataeibacter sp. FNDCR2]